MPTHGPQETDTSANIDAIVFERDLSRLANGLCHKCERPPVGLLVAVWDVYLERRKVDDTVYLRVGLKDLVECSLIGNVPLMENWSLAADELDTVQGNFGGVIEVIHNNDIVVVLK
jgi:hypothetical protein